MSIITAFMASTFAVFYPPYCTVLIPPLLATGVVILSIAVIAWFRKPVWALYAAVFVVLLPIGILPTNIHSFLNRSLALSAFVTWLFGILTRRQDVKWTFTTFLMLSFLIWGSITLTWANNLDSGMISLQTYALRMILFLILVPSQVRTQKELDGLMGTLALNGCLLILLSAGMILIEGYEPGTRFKLFLENENALGIMILITMPGILWQAMQPFKRHRVLRMLLAAMFLIMAIVLIGISGSRGSILSLILTMALFWFWKPTRMWGKLGLLILVFAALIAPFVFTTTIERFINTAGYTPLGERKVLWQTGWQLIREQPLLGVGIGNSPFEVRKRLSAFDYDRVDIHNPILVIWSETGLIGITLYLGALIGAFCSFGRQFKLKRSSGNSSLPMYVALISSVFIGYMISWIKGGGIESDHSYFLMLALLVIPSCLSIEAHPRSLQPVTEQRKSRVDSALSHGRPRIFRFIS